MSFAISTFSVTLCYELVYSTALLGRELGKRLVLESAASKSQSSNPALPTMCWVLILSGLSSLSLSGPAKPLAEEELLLLAVLSSCTSWKCCKMIFVLSGVNT